MPSPDIDICPVTDEDLDAILEVYRQCEDFLALGPVSTASMGMVLADLKLSKDQGGIFCGIYQSGEMIGVVDYVLSGFKGRADQAYLSLLMIAGPYRSKGVGEAVVRMVEAEIKQNPEVKIILAGVQINNPGGIRFWQRMGYQITSGPIDYPDLTTAYDLKKVLG